MRVLREVEGQNERFVAGIFDFHAAAIEGGLGDEADLGIDFAKFHVLVVLHRELAHATAATVRVEQGGALWVEVRLRTGSDGEAENRAFLVAHYVSVDDPLRIHTVAGKFLGGDGRARIFLDEVRVLIGFEVEGIDEEFPVFVTGFRIVFLTAGIERIRRADSAIQREILGEEMLVHRDVELMGAEIRRRVQHAVGHYEAVVDVHHRMWRQVSHTVVFALAPALHASEELVLRYKRVKSHGRGVIVRWTDSGVVERIDIVDFPLGPVKVVGDGVQVVEFLGHDRPGGLTEQGLRKFRDFFSHDGHGIRFDQILQGNHLAGRREHVRFTFAERSFACAGIDHPCHDRHRAAHPDFIQTGSPHVVRVVGFRIETQAFAWGAKCPAGIAVQKLENAVILIEAIIEKRIRSAAGTIDHIEFWVFVQLIREN